MSSRPILILRPQQDDPAAEDQTLGARLAAGTAVAVMEARFDRDRPDGLESALGPWRGRIAGVVGAMNVPAARRLGELAEAMDVLCFVANNNPAVWQRRRHVFHIGYPTVQTTAAVAAELIGTTGCRRYLMLHDPTEFQTRVAVTMQERLKTAGMDARALPYDNPGAPLPLADGWRPDVVYVVFSREAKALRTIAAAARELPGVPLVLGRSLLRDSFLQQLDGQGGELWFVDTDFRRPHRRSNIQSTFMEALASNGIAVPTTNHAFGWDALTFCAQALRAADGQAAAAIDWLESGAALEGAGGPCRFSPENHNGRHGPGPTILSRRTDAGFDDIAARAPDR